MGKKWLIVGFLQTAWCSWTLTMDESWLQCQCQHWHQHAVWLLLCFLLCCMAAQGEISNVVKNYNTSSSQNAKLKKHWHRLFAILSFPLVNQNWIMKCRKKWKKTWLIDGFLQTTWCSWTLTLDESRLQCWHQHWHQHAGWLFLCFFLCCTAARGETTML